MAEAAQADYEALRASVAAGVVPASPAWARFCRRGLVGLIEAPLADPAFSAVLAGGIRPRWSPHHDPRVEALRLAYELVLDGAVLSAEPKEVRR